MASLNSKIIAFLNINNISYEYGGYQTIQPENEPDQILYWDEAKLGVMPTTQQLDDAYGIWSEQQAKNDNKLKATQLLQETDWVDIPAVSDPLNNPHLTNRNEFNSYRLVLRGIAVNPPVVVDPWPVCPVEIWSS